MRILPHKVHWTSREIYVKVGGTNMDLLFADAWLGNLSGCTLMTLLLTLTLKGDSWANQLRALTATGHSDGEIPHRAWLALRSAVPQDEEAQRAHIPAAWFTDMQCFHLLNKAPVMLS